MYIFIPICLYLDTYLHLSGFFLVEGMGGGGDGFPYTTWKCTKSPLLPTNIHTSEYIYIYMYMYIYVYLYVYIYMYFNLLKLHIHNNLFSSQWSEIKTTFFYVSSYCIFQHTVFYTYLYQKPDIRINTKRAVSLANYIRVVARKFCTLLKLPLALLNNWQGNFI